MRYHYLQVYLLHSFLLCLLLLSSQAQQDCTSPNKTTTTDPTTCTPLSPCLLPSLDKLHLPATSSNTPPKSSIKISLCWGVSELNRTLHFQHLLLVRIGAESGGGRHQVVCVGGGGGGAGLLFDDVDSVSLERITLSGCGFVHRLNDNITLPVSIFISCSTRVWIEGVVMTETLGMGVVLREVKESHFSSCMFEHARQNKEEGVSGAEKRSVFIEITSNQTSHYITNSTFMSLASGSSGSETTPKMTPRQTHKDSGLGVEVGGGGVGVSLLDQASHNYILLSYCRFEQAWGERGGATYILIQYSASNNTIRIAGSEYTGNTASEEGGAIAASFLLSLPQSPTPSSSQLSSNKIEITDCDFVNNYAPVGGALQLNFGRGSPSCEGVRNWVELTKCSWTRNQAHHGAAINIAPLHSQMTSSTPHEHPDRPIFTLRECNFEHNVVIWKSVSRTKDEGVWLKRRGQGTVRVTECKFSIVGMLHFRNNTGSALYLKSSVVEFKRGSRSTFTSNEGYQGGAVALIGHESAIHLQDNTTLHFVRNKATGKGGAIYQEESKVCFLARIVDNEDYFMENLPEIQFHSNDAKEEGGAIFVSSLTPCMGSIHKEGHYIQVLNAIANMSFDADETSVRHVATLGWRMHGKSYLEAVPGKETDLVVWMTDDRDHNVTTNFKISVSNEESEIKVVAGYTKKRIKILGPAGSELELRVSPIHMPDLEFRVKVRLSQCPPGYFNSDNRECTCSNRYIGIQSCNHTHFQATLTESYWAGYVTGEEREGEEGEVGRNETVFATAFCPSGFCSYSNNNILLPPNTSGHDLSEVVCRDNRMGKLCARCLENHSVFFPTFYACKRNKLCGLGWLFYILSQIAPITVLFFVVIALDIDMTSGALGSCILYIQSFNLMHVTGNRFIWFEPKVHKLIKLLDTLSMMSNLRFFATRELSFCLWEGADSLDVIAFNYATYVHALFLVVYTVKVLKPCAYRLARRRRRRRRGRERGGEGGSNEFLSSSIIHGLTGFLVLCYSQCTYISIYLLASTKLYSDGSWGNERFVFYNADLKFFRDKHLVYAIPATFFLLIISILPPCLLLCYPLCYRLLALLRIGESRFTRLLCRVVPLERYKPLFDSFQGSFRDEHRYFAGLFFVYRLAVIMTSAYVRELETFYVILGVELLIMLLLSALVQPHKKSWHNKVDCLVFFVMLIINSCTIFMYHKRADSPFRPLGVVVVGTFQVLVAYLPVVYALGYVLVQAMLVVREKLRKWKMRREERKGGSVDSHQMIVSHSELSCDHKGGVSYQELVDNQLVGSE